MQTPAENAFSITSSIFWLPLVPSALQYRCAFSTTKEKESNTPLRRIRNYSNSISRQVRFGSNRYLTARRIALPRSRVKKQKTSNTLFKVPGQETRHLTKVQSFASHCKAYSRATLVRRPKAVRSPSKQNSAPRLHPTFPSRHHQIGPNSRTPIQRKTTNQVYWK